MPVMPSDVPQYLEAALKVIFLQEVNTLKPDYERVCTTIKTTQETQDYGWVGSPPAIREFIDERVGKGLAVSGMKITDKTWEATLAISRRTLENDQIGAIHTQIREMAQRMIQGVDEYAFTMLRESYLGVYGSGFDNWDKNGASRGSVYFTSDSHTYPEPAEYTTVQDNYTTGALTDTTLWTAYTKMMTVKDDRGKIMPHKPDLIVCAPQVWKTALQLVTPMTLSVAATVAYANVSPQLQLDVLPSPYWVDVTAGNAKNCWALARTTGTMKPLILQLFSPAANGQLFEFSSLEGNSDNGFMRDMYYYGIRGRWNMAYGDWKNWEMAVVT